MLVSVIMPTWNRAEFLPAAIACFQQQTYPDRELVIVDDGDRLQRDLVPDDPKINYIFLDKKVSTGEKRNVCCEWARGEVICHFDDDDWSDPGRIAYQVDRLQKSGKPITGFGTVLYWDIVTKQAKIYRSATANAKNYICGMSFCYLKSFWEKHPFADLETASDNEMIYPRLKEVDACSAKHFLVARIHGRNVSSKGGITEIIPASTIPGGFWVNEELRLRQAA